MAVSPVPNTTTASKLGSGEEKIAEEAQLTEAPSYGPAMSALSPQQRIFVETYVEEAILKGRPNQTAAMRAAYPTQSDKDQRANGSHMMRNERILAAIREVCISNYGYQLPVAQGRTYELMNNPRHPDHWRALKWVQETMGVAPVQRAEKTVTHEHLVDLSLLHQKVKMLASKHGIDLTPLIEHRREVPLVIPDEEPDD